jgi:hypothetical protein
MGLEPAQLGDQVAMHQLVDLVGGTLFGLEVGDVDRHDGELLVLAVMIQKNVAHDGEEPQTQPRAGLEQVKFLDRALERVLDQVVGGCAAAGKRSAVAPQRRNFRNQRIDGIAHDRVSGLIRIRICV